MISLVRNLFSGSAPLPSPPEDAPGPGIGRDTLAFAAAALVLFYLTSQPGMTDHDSAELAAGTRLLSMVHAPGYPLYMLLGRLFTALSDFPGRGLVLLSVTAGALAVGVLHAALRREFGSMAAAAGATGLLFCHKFWMIATEAEVYAIQVLFSASTVAVLLALRRAPSGRGLRLLGFLLGLSYAHHISILIHLPVILLFAAWHVRRPRWQDVMAGCGYAAAGVALYGALMLLSLREDMLIIDWKRIETFKALFRVATGGGFKRLLFAVPIAEVLVKLAAFPVGVLMWFPLPAALLAVVGIAAARRDPSLTLLLGAMIAITVFHAANYDVFDPENFVIPALLPVAVLIAPGFLYLRDRFRVATNAQLGIVGLVAAFGLFSRIMFFGFTLTAEHNTLVLDQCRGVLRAHDARGDSSVIWAHWAYFPPLKYLQLVEGLGSKVFVEMDSTSWTPGSRSVPGRTYTMEATFPLGARFPLVMEDLHWRVDTGLAFPPEPDRDTPAKTVLSVGGIDVLDVAFPDSVAEDRLIPVMIRMRRSAATAADTVTGHVALLDRGEARIQAPIAPLHWHLMPARWETGVIYREPVQLIVPSAYRARREFTLRIHLGTETTALSRELGSIRITP